MDSPKEDHLCTVCLFSFFEGRRKKWRSREKRLGIKKEAHNKLSSIFQRSDKVKSIFKDQSQWSYEKPNPDSTVGSQSPPPPGTPSLEIPVGVGMDSQEYTMGPKKDGCQATVLEQSSE